MFSEVHTLFAQSFGHTPLHQPISFYKKPPLFMIGGVWVPSLTDLTVSTSSYTFSMGVSSCLHNYMISFKLWMGEGPNSGEMFYIIHLGDIVGLAM